MKKNKIGRPRNIGFYVKHSKNSPGLFHSIPGIMTGIRNGIQPNKVEEYLEKYQDESKYTIERFPDKIIVNCI